MCTVSNIGDGFMDRWKERYPIQPHYPPQPFETTRIEFFPPQVSREEFEELKKEILSLKELLAAAKKYDEISGQKDCEMEDKIAFMRKVGEWMGVDLESVFK